MRRAAAGAGAVRLYLSSMVRAPARDLGREAKAAEIRVPRHEPGPPETLTDADYGNLLRVPDRRTVAGKRASALLRVLGDCGLRAAELRGLRARDLRCPRAYAGYHRLYVRGKGGRERESRRQTQCSRRSRRGCWRACATSRTALATLTATARLRAELGEDIELALTPGPVRAIRGARWAYALELPQRVAIADGKRMIVFFNEFQEVAASGQPFGDTDRLTKEMRAIFQRSDQVSSGQLSVRGLDRALLRLVELGREHPRSTMLIARETLRAARTQEPAVAGAVELDAGFQAALAHDQLRHEQVLERIRLTRHAQTISMRIARQQRPYPGLNASQTQRALRALELIGVAERSTRGE